MVKRLILMRHAKSSWVDPRLDDHARPLNDRGRRAAHALGNWLRRHQYLPDEILCSDSIRTRETAERLSLDSRPTFVSALYHASAVTMMTVLRRATRDSVLLIGHNPGISEFADRLLVRRPDHARFADYPTCATLVAEFPATTWTDVQFGTGQPLNFVVPRDMV